jgi:hypothetical protein
MKKYPHNHDPAQVDAYRPGALPLSDQGTLTVTFHAYQEDSDQIQLGPEPPWSSVRIGTKTAILDLRVDGTLLRENLHLRQGETVRVPEIGYDLEAVFVYLPNPKDAGYIPDFVWLRFTTLTTSLPT